MKGKDKIYKVKHTLGHAGVAVRSRNHKTSTVLMSTKPYSGKKKNIPMERNANPKDSRRTFFIRKVEDYPKSAFGRRFRNDSLTKSDRRKATKLVKEHQKRQDRERAERRRISKLAHRKRRK